MPYSESRSFDDMLLYDLEIVVLFEGWNRTAWCTSETGMAVASDSLFGVYCKFGKIDLQ